MCKKLLVQKVWNEFKSQSLVKILTLNFCEGSKFHEPLMLWNKFCSFWPYQIEKRKGRLNDKIVSSSFSIFFFYFAFKVPNESEIPKKILKEHNSKQQNHIWNRKLKEGMKSISSLMMIERRFLKMWQVAFEDKRYLSSKILNGTNLQHSNWNTEILKFLNILFLFCFVFCISWILKTK